MLFAIWSAVGIVAEVPSGALADRFSRRFALAAAGVLQALGYLVWIGLPGFPGYAAGFVLWGLGGALVSGALEALLYDGLAAEGAQEEYATVLGRVTAAGLLAEVPAVLAATLLFALGGYRAVAWVSVGCCLAAAAALALRLPEARPGRIPPGDGDGDGGDAATEPPYVTQLAHADGIPVDDGTLEQARDALARVLKSEDEWRGSYGDLLVSNVRETVEELRGRL